MVPIVLTNVLKMTLAFRQTVLAISSVSSDSLDVSWPAQRELVQPINDPVLSIFISVCLHVEVSRTSRASCLVLLDVYTQSGRSERSLTCFNRFKESNLLFGQSSKQLEFDFARERVDGAEQEASSAACTQRTGQESRELRSGGVSAAAAAAAGRWVGGWMQRTFTFPERRGTCRGQQS